MSRDDTVHLHWQYDGVTCTSIFFTQFVGNMSVFCTSVSFCMLYL